MTKVQWTRRGALGLTAGVAAGFLTRPPAVAATGSDRGVLPWIDRHAVPLRSTDPQGSYEDLWPLSQLVGGAALVGVGESSHGTHEQFTLKHRVARFLVEKMGFRTISWEEDWGSGAIIDRYAVTGEGDPRAIVASAGFNLQSEDMVDLMAWMRKFNRGRSEDDKVRFLGADVLQLRALLYDELRSYVADVAPERVPDLERHLHPIRFRNSPYEHRAWYASQTEQRKRELVAHARAVYDLACELPTGQSRVDREDAVQHAHAILGFHDSNTATGMAQDLRDRYIVEIIARWRLRTRHRIIYSAANAHTAAGDSMIISFPPDAPVERELAGGRLRRRYGRSYVSVGMAFHSGEILAGWDDYPPSVYRVPAPDRSFVDHQLGGARYRDYFLNLHNPAPPPVRRWFDGPATMRSIGANVYDSNIDPRYHLGVDSWRGSFDAVMHVHTVTPTPLLSS